MIRVLATIHPSTVRYYLEDAATGVRLEDSFGTKALAAQSGQEFANVTGKSYHIIEEDKK